MTASVVQSERCLKNAFPVISGGERDEEVKCLVFDPVNEYFIVGGKTLSNDYGPSLSRHGFLYAIDLEGNWAWGRFYYNSSAINDITGCTLSTDGKQVVALGVGLSQPVMMVLNTTDGSIDYLASLQNQDGPRPVIKTYGAILLDNYNPTKESTIFVSYLMSNKMLMVNLKYEVPGEGESVRLNWNYQFDDLSVFQ